jgi:hypothetical protein
MPSLISRLPTPWAVLSQSQPRGRVLWSGGNEGVVVNLSDVLELVARW